MSKLIKICLLVFFFLTGFFSWLVFEFYFPKSDDCEQEKIFQVSKGESFRDIGDNLQREELIRSSFAFKTYVVIFGEYGQLKAGDYLIKSCDNMAGIVSKISKGDVYWERITIIEGWNLKQVAEYLDDLGFVDQEIFLKITQNRDHFKEEFSFLKDMPESSSLEGYLFPDTYLISLNSSAEDIIKIILSNFDSKLTLEMKEEIKDQGKSIFETIVIASLIEKEVRTYEDKELVSGIIQKRMEIEMPLQIDATIAYITGKRTTRISIAETQIESPYNTYRYKGLPVGPISNPGIESIKAAIYPKESDYLFYLSKPDGETVFSKNLEEHNIAKNKYLR